MWTGISDSMVYYLTPVELIERVESDPTFHELGVKVSGRVVEGSWTRENGGRGAHEFMVADLEDTGVTVAVHYDDVVPDTFNDKAEVVVEGKYGSDGSIPRHHGPHQVRQPLRGRQGGAGSPRITSSRHSSGDASGPDRSAHLSTM